MNRKKLTLIAAVVITPLLFSSSPIVSKILLQQFPPFSVAFLRFLIAALVIMPFWAHKALQVPKWHLLLIPTMLFGTANITLFIIGINLTIPNASQVIYTATPLVVILFSHFFLDERLTIRKLNGIIIGLIGAVSILVLPAIRYNEAVIGNLYGNTLIAIAMLTWAGYTISSRHISTKYHYSPLFLTGLSMITTMLILGTLSFLFDDWHIVVQHITFTTFLLICYSGIGTTIATYFLYQWIIKHASATTASLNAYLQPPFGFFYAWLFLGTPLSWEFIVGTIITFIGVYLATSGKISKKELLILPQE